MKPLQGPSSILSKRPTTINIKYTKSPTYQTFFFDTIYGGLSPTGLVFIDIGVSKTQPPEKIKHELEFSGNVGKELSRDGGTDLAREIIAGLAMNIDMAERLRNWLDERINEYKQTKKRH